MPRFNFEYSEITVSGAILRQAVCVGVDDYADIDLEGSSSRILKRVYLFI